MTDFPRVASFKTAGAFRARLRALGVSLEFDDSLDPPASSPLARPFELDGVRVGNRFCILPMEGWDGTEDGYPTELTRRRWEHFGVSGAKTDLGRRGDRRPHDGRANPRQVMLNDANAAGHRRPARDARGRAPRSIRPAPDAISTSASSSRTRDGLAAERTSGRSRGSLYRSPAASTASSASPPTCRC